MGEQISADSYTPRQRSVYRRRLEDELEFFDRHLQEAEFVSHGTIGLELELNLVDAEMRPHANNQAVLERLGDEFQSEIGAYNVELNHPPLSIAGDGLTKLEEGLSRRHKEVSEAAEAAGSTVAMIGTLPTMTSKFLKNPAWMTPENRYAGLNNSIMDTRGELVHLNLWREATATTSRTSPPNPPAPPSSSTCRFPPRALPTRGTRPRRSLACKPRCPRTPRSLWGTGSGTNRASPCSSSPSIRAPRS